ncbi:ATP-binding protein [Kribbella sp. NPDC048928]|uniref:sensor histidine kinase n=1 Tax=Kribbella sp. NPDC048928 TaxID=3364111 RepID=UPI0037189EC5
MTRLWSRMSPTDPGISWPDVVLALGATAVTQYWLVQRADYWAYASPWLPTVVAWSALLIAVRRVAPALAMGGLLAGAYGWSLLAGGVPWPLLVGCLLAAWWLPTRWGTRTGVVLCVVLAGLPLLADLRRGWLQLSIYPHVFVRFVVDGQVTTVNGIAQVAWKRVTTSGWTWWFSVVIAVFAVAALLLRRRQGVTPVRRTAGERLEGMLRAVRRSSDELSGGLLLGAAAVSMVFVELWGDRVHGNWWTAPGWLPYVVAFAPLTLAARRRVPAVPVAVIGLAALLSYWQTDKLWLLLFALAVALYSVGTARQALRWSMPMAIVVLAALPTIAALVKYPVLVRIYPGIANQPGLTYNQVADDMVNRRWPVSLSLALLVPLCVGIAVRLYRRNVQSAQREAELEQVAVEREVARVVLTERSHIARDLHDVVAHAVNLMVIQAETGPDLVRRGDADVLAGFQRIGDAGRRALSELDRLLSALRDADGVPDPQLAPQPGLADLPQLVADVSDGHLPVELEVSGDLDGPSEGQQVAAYRVVQEALTNVIRHAKASAAQVRVRVEQTGVRVEVSDDGSGFDVAAAADGMRHGLAGMRERVRIEGGTLDLRSTPGSGTTVTAWFPVEGSR